jgi:hypothetical protein
MPNARTQLQMSHVLQTLMAKLTMSLLQIALIAAMAASAGALTPQADVVTLNANGGTNVANGIKFDWGLGDFMIWYLGGTLIDSTGIDGESMSDQAFIALAIGDTVYWGTCVMCCLSFSNAVSYGVRAITAR